MIRHSGPITLLALAVAALVAPVAARAGTYDVVSCHPTADNVNRAWVYETNDGGHLEADTTCGTDQRYSGTYVRTRLGSAGGSSGALGQWIVRAPSGTVITSVHIKRWLGMEAGSGWRPYGRQADGTTLSGESCNAGAGSDECNIGGVGTPPIHRFVNTNAIAYGIECVSVYGCPTGATIHAARAAIYSSTITISDSGPPALTASSGTLINESVYHRGTETAWVNGHDTTGLKALRLYVDGVERATQDLACDYTYVAPCSNPSNPHALSVDLAALRSGSRVIADGEHSVQVAAVDAAGNETRSAARSIVVDATAPEAPSSLASSTGSTWQTSPDFTVTWTPPAGQVAPIDTAHWTLCAAGTTSDCLTGSAPVAASDGTLSGLRVPTEGAWDFSLRLEDAAGNASAASSARTTIRYDASAPAASPNLTVANRSSNDPALMAWFNPPSGQQAPVTEALWTLCPQGTTTGCATGRFGTDPYGTNYLRTAIPGPGDWNLTVRLRDQAGNLGAPATASLRYASSRPTPTPTPPPTLAPNPSPSATATPTPRRSAELRLTSAVLVRSRGMLVVKGRTAAGATGRVRVEAAVTRNGRTHTLARMATLRAGRFTVRMRLPRDARRGGIRVEAAYPGSTSHAPGRVARRPVKVR